MISSEKHIWMVRCWQGKEPPNPSTGICTALVMLNELFSSLFDDAKSKYASCFLQDLLYVIAYGPSQVKPPAVQMLFHYWPNLKPPGAISEYRGLQYTGKKGITLSCPIFISLMPHLPHCHYYYYLKNLDGLYLCAFSYCHKPFLKLGGINT